MPPIYHSLPYQSHSHPHWRRHLLPFPFLVGSPETPTQPSPYLLQAISFFTTQNPLLFGNTILKAGG